MISISGSATISATAAMLTLSSRLLRSAAEEEKRLPVKRRDSKAALWGSDRAIDTADAWLVGMRVSRVELINGTPSGLRKERVRPARTLAPYATPVRTPYTRPERHNTLLQRHLEDMIGELIRPSFVGVTRLLSWEDHIGIERRAGQGDATR